MQGRLARDQHLAITAHHTLGARGPRAALDALGARGTGQTVATRDALGPLDALGTHAALGPHHAHGARRPGTVGLGSKDHVGAGVHIEVTLAADIRRRIRATAQGRIARNEDLTVIALGTLGARDTDRALGAHGTGDTSGTSGASRARQTDGACHARRALGPGGAGHAREAGGTGGTGGSGGTAGPLRPGGTGRAHHGGRHPLAAEEHQGLPVGGGIGGEVQGRALQLHHQRRVLRARDITGEGAGEGPGAVGLEGGDDIDIRCQEQARQLHMQLQPRLAQQGRGQGRHPCGTQHHGVEALVHGEGEVPRGPLFDPGVVEDGEREDARPIGRRRPFHEPPLVSQGRRRRHIRRRSERRVLGLQQRHRCAGNEGGDGGGEE